MVTRWVWAMVSLVSVLALMFVRGAGPLLLGPLASLVIGALAARAAVRGQNAALGRASTAGAIAGIGALLATIVAFALLGHGLGLDPSIQDFVRTSEPHPEARVPHEWIAPLGAALGGVAGLAMGLINLALSSLGGTIMGLWSGAQPSPSVGQTIR